MAGKYEAMAWLSVGPGGVTVRLYEPIVKLDGVTWAYVPRDFAEAVEREFSRALAQGNEDWICPEYCCG